MSKIAFFDFDGTITTKDTLLEYIRYRYGNFRFFLGFLINSPWLIAYKLGMISNHAAKERMMRHFFGHTASSLFEQQCRTFAEQHLPTIVRPRAMEEMRKLMEAGFEIVIVSASPFYWIKPWSDGIPATLIATRLEEKDGKITGKIAGKNCHGQEKVYRIKEQFALETYSQVYAYGDTSADRYMMSLAGISFYKPFL